jgi:hypothetical protein
MDSVPDLVPSITDVAFTRTMVTALTIGAK